MDKAIIELIELWNEKSDYQEEYEKDLEEEYKEYDKRQTTNWKEKIYKMALYAR